jgi:chemotaxis protein methyltransferase CheR
VSIPNEITAFCSGSKGQLLSAAKPMTQAEFNRFSEFIIAQCGIKMPPSKKIMLEARLQKRLRVLGFVSFREYFEHIRSRAGRGEVVHMLDAVTTNKTDFFREPGHFQFLAGTVLPAFIEGRGDARVSGQCFRIWSAGCSTGEEPYTLAMVLADFTDRHPTFRFAVLASDLSTKVLDRAREAIYDEGRTAGVPLSLKQRYFLRNKDRSKALLRIVPSLRAMVQFQRVNLMDEALVAPDPFDAIFCRNVIIYFDRGTQERLLRRFCGMLRPGGYLFLGHSESIHGFDLPLIRMTSTVHRRCE